MADCNHQVEKEADAKAPIKICHIGGMSLHKGYQLFRQAVHSMEPGLKLEFTVIDHRLASQKDEYSSIWNGYRVQFIAPIAMEKMNEFYASQDVLVAPSIWPESFGLVHEKHSVLVSGWSPAMPVLSRTSALHCICSRHHHSSKPSGGSHQRLNRMSPECEAICLTN